MQFIQAKWYRKGPKDRPVRFLVIHDMEAPEKATTAELVAAYFARGTVKASCHYCVDNNSTVQCVKRDDIAFHAPPNDNSIGIEHAGYARQSKSQWLDAYGVQMLTRSAVLMAELCLLYDIPIIFLSVADLKAGKKGITTHRNVSEAWHQSHHTDPGPHFPISEYMSLVRKAADKPTRETVSLSRVRRASVSKKAQHPIHTRRLQRSLINRGHLTGRYIPGNYGKKTKDAYGKHQTSRGEKPTGVPDYKSLRALVGPKYRAIR